MPTYMSAVPRSTVGQGDGAAEHIGDVPSPLQRRAGSGVALVRLLELTGRPGCESEQRRYRSAPEKIVLGHEMKCPPGIGDGVGHLAQQQGVARAVHGHRTGKTATLQVV